MSNLGEAHTLKPGKLYRRRLKEGVTLLAEVGLCVFMYPGYSLTIEIKRDGKNKESLGVAYAVDRRFDAATSTDDAVKDLLGRVRITPCRRCESPAFDPTTVETNRDGLCERCFSQDVQSAFEKEAAKEQRQVARELRAMKAKGMRFQVTAWVHPTEGDDYEVSWFCRTRPTASQIAAILRGEGSTLLDDFALTTL